MGGQRGREALDRLRNVIVPHRIVLAARQCRGRVRDRAKATVRAVRRLGAVHGTADVVARAFADLYRGQRHEFPPECRNADYEQRMKAAYPDSPPRIFDRLYSDWSTLVTFQRTRGACCG